MTVGVSIAAPAYGADPLTLTEYSAVEAKLHLLSLKEPSYVTKSLPGFTPTVEAEVSASAGDTLCCQGVTVAKTSDDEASGTAAEPLASTPAKSTASKGLDVEAPGTLVSMLDESLRSASSVYRPSELWKCTEKGNFICRFPGFGMGKIVKQHTGKWKYVMDGKYSDLEYDTPHLAESAFTKDFHL